MRGFPGNNEASTAGNLATFFTFCFICILCFSLSLSLCMYVHIYIYIHIHTIRRAMLTTDFQLSFLLGKRDPVWHVCPSCVVITCADYTVQQRVPPTGERFSRTLQSIRVRSLAVKLDSHLGESHSPKKTTSRPCHSRGSVAAAAGACSRWMPPGRRVPLSGSGVRRFC